MTSDRAEFLNDLQRQVSLSASVDGNELGLSEAFTDYMFGVLTDAGEIDEATVAPFQAQGARASGFAVSEDESTLWLFLADYRADLEPQALGKTDLDAHYRRMTGFLERARDGLWKKLEESAPSWDMAQRLAEVWDQLGEIRLVVLTNAELRTAAPGIAKLDDRSVHHSVWDLTRLHQLDTSGRAQEPISIDVLDLWGEPLPCLGPHGDPGAYESYLLMLPGEFVARIYEKFGPRLLELNVRSFLQARGKINKGIQETIKSEPRRFLAYNNGLSMTAADVHVAELPDGGRGIAAISDLQIVNGGQTSASLHFAKVKHKADLSGIYVESKLSVVHPTVLIELVPRISQFANRQNKVNMADFSANDPFHVEVEKLSRTVWAPGRRGTAELTHWFYERARGQYADALGRERTPARQRNFKLASPPNQRFTKTDLAKYENLWDQLPWIVSTGAEKNFREFTLRLEKRGAAFVPDQTYFELLVAKAILFKEADKLVDRLKLGGYKSQTVSYTIAKISNVTGQRLALRDIWRSQTLLPVIIAAIEDLAPKVHAALWSTAGSRNISEWAKKEDCWKAVKDLAWGPPDSLVSGSSSAARRTASTSTTSIGEHLSNDEQTAFRRVLAVAGDDWKALSAWAKETGNLQGWQRSIAFSLGRLIGSGKEPSRKQAVQGALILNEAQRLGFAATSRRVP